MVCGTIRRRDAHNDTQRNSVNVKPPFLEQPWVRSGQGKMFDGLPKYDLSQYNDGYIQRLKQLAGYCDRKGTILFHNHDMQHALLETHAHQDDFWRKRRRHSWTFGCNLQASPG
ncbi:hypothetical protein Pla52o_53720 [Novipirellula galeiformis]|uniref:DUF6298 domain-containing protein n=1 Tax=Novipirellula galeiformis TaxID=2528004 RepID=A0A5C6BZR9_9BACT|nr:hypothetical protein Pla52o_53720 [Novipirellula galeiformis]